MPNLWIDLSILCFSIQIELVSHVLWEKSPGVDAYIRTFPSVHTSKHLWYQCIYTLTVLYSIRCSIALLMSWDQLFLLLFLLNTLSNCLSLLILLDSGLLSILCSLPPGAHVFVFYLLGYYCLLYDQIQIFNYYPSCQFYCLLVLNGQIPFQGLFSIPHLFLGCCRALHTWI